jgi:hypothetical protein
VCAILGLQLRALCFLGRCSIAWATAPVLCKFLIITLVLFFYLLTILLLICWNSLYILSKRDLCNVNWQIHPNLGRKKLPYKEWILWCFWFPHTIDLCTIIHCWVHMLELKPVACTPPPVVCSLLKLHKMSQSSSEIFF